MQNLFLVRKSKNLLLDNSNFDDQGGARGVRLGDGGTVFSIS